jgi:ribosomal protein S27AE
LVTASSTHWSVSRMFRKPRGALYDERPADAARPWATWFWVASYVLVGLLAGAAASNLAVNRGLPGWPWFLIGLLVNVLGVLLVLGQRPRDAVSAPQGIPAGLRKVPVTRAPRACPECGALDHPSARVCGRCGHALVASSVSEVDAAGLGSGQRAADRS